MAIVGSRVHGVCRVQVDTVKTGETYCVSLHVDSKEYWGNGQMGFRVDMHMHDEVDPVELLRKLAKDLQGAANHIETQELGNESPAR